MGLLTFRRRGRALSDRSTASSQGGPGCLIGFGLLFGGFGSIFVVIFLVLPLMRALEARQWVEVPCTILESRLGESRDSDGATYRVEVRYEYRFRAGDLESDPTAPLYQSERYDFYDGVYTSGAEAKRAEVARLAPGTRTTCRVDPHHPEEAVLRPGIPDGLWWASFVLLFPLIGFALVIGGVVGVIRGRRQRAGRVALSAGASLSDMSPGVPDVDLTGPVELRPAQGRLAKLMFLGVFALVWNGISWGIILFAILPDLRGGDNGAWFPLVFLSLFALIGLVIAGAFIHQFLALGNPRLRLTVNRRAFRAGETLEVEWECSGNPSRISTLTIAVEGRESATYTRGTDTTTETHVFARLTLATLDDAAAILSGRARLVLPADAVATFIAPRNRIEWSLTVRGVIPRWPDISDDYPLTVLPPRSAP
jgi:hypothetical protein